MKTRIGLGVVLVLIAALYADAVPPRSQLAADTHEGTFVSLSGDKLTMTGSNGSEHSHTVAKDVKYVVDGKDAKASDFKPGMKIRVTTVKAADGKTAVTMLEGLDKKTSF